MTDDVTCNNCGVRSEAEAGADECPACGFTGALRWTEDDE